METWLGFLYGSQIIREPNSDTGVSTSNATARRPDMDWNRVEGNWKQVKGKVKEQWGKLTDGDLDVIAGKQDQLEGKIQERMATRRIRSERKLTTGTAARFGSERYH
jgi:uncharacterized protein YjbJ (UPF0337 family)